jgi:hypothetical protein
MLPYRYLLEKGPDGQGFFPRINILVASHNLRLCEATRMLSGCAVIIPLDKFFPIRFPFFAEDGFNAGKKLRDWPNKVRPFVVENFHLRSF